MKPTIGKKAPAFTGKDQDDNTIALKDFIGQKVALYCYPKDDTTTCTTQACNLRDNFSLLQKHGIAIIGISPDDGKVHTKFRAKYQLPFPLIADTEQTILKKYGVWDWKKFMGREYIGVHRTTFLIDEKGVLRHIIDQVKAKEHSHQILKVWGLV